MPLFAPRRPLAALSALDLRRPLTEAAAPQPRKAAKRTTRAQSRAQTAIEAAAGGSFARHVELSALHDAYITTPFISAPIDAIARRMTSGGWDVEPTPWATKKDTGLRDAIIDTLAHCNDEDDLNSMNQSLLTAALIFGFGAYEVVDAAGLPDSLYYIDPTTLSVKRDEYGTILEFVQRMADGSDKVTLSPDQVVYFPIKGARGEIVSPIRKLLTEVTIHANMMRWNQKWFEHGAQIPFWIDLGNADQLVAENFVAWWDEHMAGVENRGRPFVGYDGAKIASLTGTPPVAFDYLEGLKWIRETFLSVLGVPPSAVAVTDNGNRLTDMGPAQDKMFRYNTIEPLRRLVEEKLTYRICAEGFNTPDWRIVLKERAYEADDYIIKTVVEKVSAGLMTRNEAAQELGMPKIPGKGGNVTTVTLSREIVPTDDLVSIHGSQYQAAQQAGAEKGISPKMTPHDLSVMSPKDPSDEPQAPPAAPLPVGQPDPQTVVGNKPSKPEAAVADLVRWQKVARWDVEHGYPVRAFHTTAIPPHVACAVAEALTLADCREDVTAVFDLAFADVRDP